MNIPEVAQIPSSSNWIINKSVLESLDFDISHQHAANRQLAWHLLALHTGMALSEHAPSPHSLQKDSQCLLLAVVLFSRNICAVLEGGRKLFQGGKRVLLNTKRNIDIPLKESGELK